MRTLIWWIIARIVTIPFVTAWLVGRAQRTPYSHILSQDGLRTYMGRWWLFNPYAKDPDGNVLPARWGWLPSIRIHHIMREDVDRHLHDHPWNARTIILRGWYEEERPFDWKIKPRGLLTYRMVGWDEVRDVFLRKRGYTGRLLCGQYHRISAVPAEGVWTLFITWGYEGTWGFLVDGAPVPHREYLEAEEGRGGRVEVKA